MTLRYKFGALGLIYGIALTVNVVICAWCLLIYYQSLLAVFGSHTVSVGAALTVPDLSNEQAVLADILNTRALILDLLMANAVCGLALAVLGLLLVRRWVMRPIGLLREAAIRIGQGHLDHRIRWPADDEFGRLADRVNKMTATVTEKQNQLVRQTRKTMAYQTVRCVVHNIRSPLTGIRWLAEAVTLRKEVDPAMAECQQAIMTDVDGILHWLSEFRHSLSAATLQTETIAPQVLADDIRAATPSGGRGAAPLEIQIDPDLESVSVDRGQLVAAISVVVLRFAEQADASAAVRLRMRHLPEPAGQWQLVLESDGGQRLPNVSTRSDPYVWPLSENDRAMVENVVQLHGGTLEAQIDQHRIQLQMTLPV